jgi:hypothetical protein
METSAGTEGRAARWVVVRFAPSSIPTLQTLRQCSNAASDDARSCGTGEGMTITPLAYKAIVIIRNRDGQNIGSHLLEYASAQELGQALMAVAQWAGFHEVIRL